MIESKPLELTIRFSKKGAMRFISHLDTLRLFQRAIRRTGFPVDFSKGFSPHLKLKIIPALKLGLESNDLKAVVEFKKEINKIDFINFLKNNLPEGIEILEAN